LIGRIEGYAFDCVYPDEVAGGERLAEHLLSLGHRRLGIVGVPEGNRNARERCEGVIRAMRRAGLLNESAGEPALRISPDDGAAGFVDEVVSWLQGPEPPTALIAIHQGVALELLRPLEAIGMRIPRDVSLASFGDDPWGSRITPSLSCVDVNNTMRAQCAFDLLIQRMDDPNGPNILEPLQYTLIERESTAPPPTG